MFYLQYIYGIGDEDHIKTVQEYFLKVLKEVGDEEMIHLPPQFWFEFCKFVINFNSYDLIQEAYETAQKHLFLTGNNLDCYGKCYYYLVDYLLGSKKSDVSVLLENHIENGIYSLTDEQIIDISLDCISIETDNQSSFMER